MCFCLFILSLCFRMQLTYTLTIHLWNSILSMLPYFHEYAWCFAKRAPCVPARLWTNQIAYNYHVTSCVCRLALSYYVVKFYEWSTWYFGRNQMASYHAPPVIGYRVAGISEKFYVIATTLGKTSICARWCWSSRFWHSDWKLGLFPDFYRKYSKVRTFPGPGRPCFKISTFPGNKDRVGTMYQLYLDKLVYIVYGYQNINLLYLILPKYVSF